MELGIGGNLEEMVEDVFHCWWDWFWNKCIMSNNIFKKWSLNKQFIILNFYKKH